MATDHNAYTRIRLNLILKIISVIKKTCLYSGHTTLAVFIKHWLCKRARLLFLCDIWDGVNQLDMHSTEMEETWISAKTNFTTGNEKTQYDRNKGIMWELVRCASVNIQPLGVNTKVYLSRVLPQWQANFLFFLTVYENTVYFCPLHLERYTHSIKNRRGGWCNDMMKWVRVSDFLYTVPYCKSHCTIIANIIS